MQAGTDNQNPHSMIGKSIVIKGQVTASDPLYIYGRIEGSISAPAHRVTVGKEGTVKADISAREVVVMGEVAGKLEGSYRVEIRSEGSHAGELAAHRICVEEGAVLKGRIDVLRAVETEKAKAQEASGPALELVEEATSAA